MAYSHYLISKIIACLFSYNIVCYVLILEKQKNDNHPSLKAAQFGVYLSSVSYCDPLPFMFTNTFVPLLADMQN